MSLTPSPGREIDPRPRILVGDDQPHVCLALELLLKGEGFVVETAGSVNEILEAAGRCDVLLVDLNYDRDTTSGEEGLGLLSRLQAQEVRSPVLVMTAWGTIGLAVEAMRRGATDFILKPWNNAQLVQAVRAALARPHVQAGHSDRDLMIASRVQRRLLPQELPHLPTLDCAGRCLEAGAVGGDYYDFIPLQGKRVAIALGDASGKGISAALLAANLQASIRGHLARMGEDLPGLLSSVNRLFLESTAPEHFATLFLGIYDDETRGLRYVNCGHNPPIVRRASGSFEVLTGTAPAIGLLDDFTVGAARTTLGKGDLLVVYSDGVT